MRLQAVRWLLWAVGAVVLLWASPLGLFDPVTVALILDPELLALMIAVAITMVRLDLVTFVRMIGRRVLWAAVPERASGARHARGPAGDQRGIGRFVVGRHRS
jgi:hypothetical protein